LEYVTIIQSAVVKGIRVPKWFAEDPAVQRWLGKYGSAATKRDYAFYFLKYLEWLREVRGVSLSPSELVRVNLGNIYGSGPVDVEKKREHTDWLQEFISLDGPLQGLGNSYRATAATAIRSFYKRNDSPLFGDFQVPFDAFEEKLTEQISVEDAKRYISVLPLRSKAVCICLLQCGMRVSEFLQLKWKDVQSGIEKKETPVKIMLRNDNGLQYFTFLGTDGIEILKLYLQYRKSLVGMPVRSNEYIFINDVGSGKYRVDKPLLSDYVNRQIVRALVAKGLVEKPKGDDKWRCNFHPHALRHLFKTECAHAGINPMISQFWMGHDKGIEYVYNHQHELHPEDFVEAYRKAEPSLNIISGPSGKAAVEIRERIKRLEAEFDEFRRKFEASSKK